MSYMVAVTIACDRPGCDKSITRSLTNEGGMNKTFAAMLAHKRDGWYVRGGNTGAADPKIAYCPDHREVRGS